MILAVGFCRCSSQAEEVPSIPNLLRISVMNVCWIYQMFFLHLLIDLVILYIPILSQEQAVTLDNSELLTSKQYFLKAKVFF